MLTTSLSKNYTVSTGQEINYSVTKSTISATKNNESFSYSGFQLGDIHFDTFTEFDVNISYDFSFGINYDILLEENILYRRSTLVDNCRLNLLNNLNTGNRIAGELLLNWKFQEEYYQRGLLLEIYPVVLAESSVMGMLITLKDEYPATFAANFLNGSPIVNALIQEKKGNIIGEWDITVDYYFQHEYLYQITMSEKESYEKSTGILMGYWRKGVAIRDFENDTYSVEYEFKVERYGYELEGFEIGLYTTNSASAMILFVIMIPILPISIVSKLKRKKSKRDVKWEKN